jgi:thiamine biosynthesis lipoprotein
MEEFGRIRFPALGTTAVVATTDVHALVAAALEVQREVDAIDLACSRFRDDSDLARANAGAGSWVSAGPLLLEAVQVALRAARLTGGDVDPTVEASMIANGYDRDFAALPADGVQQPHRPATGWRAVEVDDQRARIRVPAGSGLDLGATAKALAADRAARAATRSAHTGVVVSLGGDLAIAGEPPPGGWPLGVGDSHIGVAGETVRLEGGGLATSSTTVRRWRREGRELHHIVDPRTGAPAAVVWRTVTVAAASCVDANIAATASIVRGASAPAWLAACGLHARLVTPEGDVVRVGGWPQREPRPELHPELRREPHEAPA